MSVIGNNVKNLRLKRGLSLRGLSLKCEHTTHTTIDRIEKGAETTIETLNDIAHALNSDISLITGNVSKNKIPVLGVIHAGVPIEAVEDVLDYEEISKKMAITGTYFALKIVGTSMAPKLLENDVIIVKQQQDAKSGDICVVMVNGDDATVKRIKLDKNGLWLLPENPSFDALFYSKEDVSTLPVKIIGKAVEIRRSVE